MVEASCHCRAVVLELAAPPSSVVDCSCSICRRLGVLWAYYPPSEVKIRSESGATLAYVWGDRRLEFHTCRTCGCTTHWRAVHSAAPTRMGVNARLVDGRDKTNTQVQHSDGGGTGCFWT